MSSLKNLERITYTNETIMTLIELYKFHGKEFYFKNLLKQDALYHQRNVVSIDTYCLSRFMNLSVSENRLRLIIENDSEPKTNDEKIVRNLKDIVELCNSSSNNFEHTANQVLSLADRLFKDVKKLQFTTNEKTGRDSLLEENRGRTKRDDIAEVFDSFIELSTSGKNEITNLICNFYIDFINIKPFKESNEIIGLILLYTMLQYHGFNQLKYVSFFEVLESKKEEFNKHVSLANYDWENNMSKVEPLNNFIINILLNNYDKLEKIVSDKIFDSKLKKTDNIENTILKAPLTFTKDYIKKLHPDVSKTTIDRTLLRLKEEGKITPLGTGRSAKWHKVNMDNDQFSLNSTLDIFSIENE